MPDDLKGKASKFEIRAVICIWCGEAITYPTDASKKVVYETMKKHDLTCVEHPLQKTIAADRKRIEELEKIIKTKAAEKMPHSFVEMEWACGHTCGAACVVCKQEQAATIKELEVEIGEHDKLIELQLTKWGMLGEVWAKETGNEGVFPGVSTLINWLQSKITIQADTIERLSIATECIETITCEDDKMFKDPKTGKWKEDESWSFVYRIVHVANARCKADHSNWEKEMMEFYEGYVRRSGSDSVDPLGHEARQALNEKEE